MEVVAEGEFSNILNNPILQEVRFAPVNARYLKLKALRTVRDDHAVCMAEMAVNGPGQS